MKRHFVLAVACLLSLLAGSAEADILYTLAITPATGPVSPFSVSFTTSDYLVTSGPIFSFPDVQVNDGTHTWDISEGNVIQGTVGGGYFQICVATAGTMYSPCSYFAFNDTAFIGMGFRGPLPSSDGVYSSPFETIVWLGGKGNIEATGVLTVRDAGSTAVPEPTAYVLLITCVAGLLVSRRRTSLMKTRM